jgi:hypothetical protein
VAFDHMVESAYFQMNKIQATERNVAIISEVLSTAFEILEFLMLASAKKFLTWLKNIFIAAAAVK